MKCVFFPVREPQRNIVQYMVEQNQMSTMSSTLEVCSSHQIAVCVSEELWLLEGKTAKLFIIFYPQFHH